MLILARDRMRDDVARLRQDVPAPARGLSRARASSSGVRIVVNAGGLNPAGLAAAVRELADRVGLRRTSRTSRATTCAREPANSVSVSRWPRTPTSARSASPRACASGADVVVTGRVTDASLVVGPAIERFGWTAADHDAIAGAMVAGHVIECGPQATGGNYAFFAELDDFRLPGFPIAEVHADGSSVITKHPGTGGAVTRRHRDRAAALRDRRRALRRTGRDGPLRHDRARRRTGRTACGSRGVRGEPPPPTVKVGLNALGGFRNETTFVLTGTQLELKERMVREQLARLRRDVDAGAHRSSATRPCRRKPPRCCTASCAGRIRRRSGGRSPARRSNSRCRAIPAST